MSTGLRLGSINVRSGRGSMQPDLSRTWFVTWTTYGTWLPGDRRGFVGQVREIESHLAIHRRLVNAPHEQPNPALEVAARARLRARPIFITADQAGVVVDQVVATVQIRNWTLQSIAVMVNHVHAVVTVPADPDPETILRDLKAYASRALNERFGTPPPGTWWTRSGSKRKCADDTSLQTRIRYVRDQPGALVMRLHPEWQ